MGPRLQRLPWMALLSIWELSTRFRFPGPGGNLDYYRDIDIFWDETVRYGKRRQIHVIQIVHRPDLLLKLQRFFAASC